MGEGIGPNLYGYVANDPVNLFDPSGLAPGDPFSTPGAAAADALNSINPTSISQNVEYGGTIYQNGNSYYAGSPVKGDSTGVNPLLSFPPPGSTVVGDYHTHGNYANTSAWGGLWYWLTHQTTPCDKSGDKL